MTRHLYRFDMITAHQRGESRHPEVVIRELAPDATDFEPVPVADCWVFRASAIQNPPEWIVPVVLRGGPKLPIPHRN
jgi:hypothetical protein